MSIQTLAHRLKTLGLNEKQAKVYVACLFLGPAPAQKIAEQAGINRPTTYGVLEELSKLGLVSRSNKDGKTMFISAGTEGLKDWLKKQAEEVERRKQELDDLLPELQQIKRTDSVVTPAVRFVQGKEGVDAIWSYVIRKTKPNTEILSITNHDETLKLYPDHLKTNPKVRLNKKMSSKQFYYNSKMEVPSDPTLLKETIRLQHPLAADLTLYEDKAVLLSYGEEGSEWTGIIIEDKNIVTVLRQLFTIAWENSDRKL
jgi:sugar-specific transcriptional regulator TrmB